jgi:hypothetical protein
MFNLKIKIMSKKVEEALQTLRDAGYYATFLWHIDDVDDDDLSDEAKLEILHNSIHKDYIYETINESIYDELLMYKEYKNISHE